jgi:hypothetical protein
MSPEVVETLFKTFGPVITLWLTWVSVSHWKSKQELDALKLYVAENYIKSDVVERALEKMDRKLDEMSGMVHSIAGRLREKD